MSRLPSTDEAPPDLRRIGAHRVVAALPSTGLLSTYEALNEAQDRVRLRVLEGSFSPTAGALTQFDADAEAASAVRVRGIAAPLVWSVEDPVHLSTAFPEGVSLDQALKGIDGGTPSPEVVAGVGFELASTLERAHRVKVVHAGLSAHNVFVSASGELKIVDYAVARFEASFISDSSHLLSELVGGLAPEQIASPEEIGPATDVFSLGVLLYRAFTGSEPFEAPSAFGVSLRLTSGAAEPIQNRGVRVPSALAEVIMAMLSTSVGARPEAEELRARFSSLTDGEARWRPVLAGLAIDAGAVEVSPPRAEPRPAVAEPLACDHDDVEWDVSQTVTTRQAPFDVGWTEDAQTVRVPTLLHPVPRADAAQAPREATPAAQGDPAAAQVATAVDVALPVERREPRWLDDFPRFSEPTQRLPKTLVLPGAVTQEHPQRSSASAAPKSKPRSAAPVAVWVTGVLASLVLAAVCVYVYMLVAG